MLKSLSGNNTVMFKIHLRSIVRHTAVVELNIVIDAVESSARVQNQQRQFLAISSENVRHNSAVSVEW